MENERRIKSVRFVDPKNAGSTGANEEKGKETVRQILERIVKTQTNSEADEKIIQKFCDMVGMPVRITCGLVYAGKFGNARPISMPEMAQKILDTVNKTATV